MQLTDKCLGEFEKWAIGWIGSASNLKVYNQLQLDLFYSQKDSMKFGLYLDYFDSVGVDIDISVDSIYRYEGKPSYYFHIFYKDGCIENGLEYNTRPEARTAAIEQANILRNEQLNKQ